MAPQGPASTCDVIVIGGGLAGKAASLHLAKAGLSVICIEPDDAARQAVGESLDWSAPDLLKALGLPMEQLVSERIATWKRHVTLQLRNGCSEQYIPSAWLAHAPFHVELRTLHVDRQRLDEKLLSRATAQGVTVVRDKVVAVEREGNKILSAKTAGGSTFAAKWFIDSSGFAAPVLTREFRLCSIEFGPPKVALWTYFSVGQAVEGTTLYMDPAPSEYLDWVWEIPINPDTVSVGYVTTGAAIKVKRERGLSVDEIFQEQLKKHPHFEPMLTAGPTGALNVTSFRCRVHAEAAGPNWIIAGEAASMVDPITANGVTAALRHAAEATTLVLKFRKRGEIPALSRALYSSRILQFAKFFNSGIERIVYEPGVRNRIGLRVAGTVYTSPAWTMNLVYNRLRPRGIVSTFLFNSAIGIFRCGAWAFYQLCRRFKDSSSRAGSDGTMGAGHDVHCGSYPAGVKWKGQSYGE
jgi:flavin-dependent dehydrogenase